MKPFFIISAALMILSFQVKAQTLDTEALSKINPAVQRQVFEVAQFVKLSGNQQLELAKAFETQNTRFIEIIKLNEGVMTVQGKNQLTKMHEKALEKVMTKEQLEEYYRGLYNDEASKEANDITDMLMKKYNLTDQNGKFIRIAFYAIGLESRVIQKMMGDQPKKAAKKIEELKKYQLNTIEEKGGLRVNPDMTITWVRKFDPNALIK